MNKIKFMVDHVVVNQHQDSKPIMSSDTIKHGSHLGAGFCHLAIHFPSKMTKTTQHVAQKTPKVPFFVLYNEAPRLFGNGTPSNSTCLIRACCRFASIKKSNSLTAGTWQEASYLNKERSQQPPGDSIRGFLHAIN